MRPTDLETVSGQIIDLDNPDPEKICINDIAWALSRIVRYNGHTVQRIPYTVGQHSIIVSEMAKLYAMEAGASKLDVELISMLALLHDAGEAFTGDLSGPLKKIEKLRPVIKEIEQKIDDAITKALNIENEKLLDQINSLEKELKQVKRTDQNRQRGLESEINKLNGLIKILSTEIK